MGILPVAEYVNSSYALDKGGGGACGGIPGWV